LSIAKTKGPFVISGLLFNNAGTVRFAAYGSHNKYFPDFEQSSKLRPIAKGVITRLAVPPVFMQRCAKRRERCVRRKGATIP